MAIISLSGYAKVGKDEVANIIRSIDPSWEIKKFSGKLKQIASIITGIPVEKFEDQEFKKTNLGPEWFTWYPNLDRPEPMTVREFLQKLGTDAIRDGLHKDAWVNALFSTYYPGGRTVRLTEYIKQDIPPSKWIITDTRFPNELSAIKVYGGKTVKIMRPGVEPVNAHPSETALDGYEFDHIIYNNGTLEDLREAVKEIL